MLSIAIRSAIGFGVAGVYADTPSMLWYLVLAAVAGKASGGFVSDWLGWIKTSLFALLVSASLLSYLVTDGPAAAIGMVLFQMTMPVTLLAMYRVFPDEPGLAFGLPTLALLVGAIPTIVFAADWLSNPSLLAGLIVASLICLSISLPLILRTDACVA
jgi:FSR family fosmidomycin resistance protein-like MFS transporter